MTSRVKALSGEVLGMNQTEPSAAFVTPKIVEDAAEQVLKDVPEDQHEMLKGMWARDSESEVAAMLRNGASMMVDRARYPTSVRQHHNVPFRLSDAEMRYVVDHYPDFNLTFNTVAGHDHGVAAAISHLDMLSMLSQMPPGMPYVDIGGNVMFHVRRGDTDCTVLQGELDGKDAARQLRTRMNLDVLIGNSEGALVGTKEEVMLRMAKSIRNDEGKYLVKGRAETFTAPFVAGIMNHVYDVPVSALPYLMERCGMKMLLVNLHFSNRFFDTDAGELKGLGARYRIDRAKDLFEFGFVDSGTSWYPHRWSQFQRYGADQILFGRKKRYSMKLIKRRGETVMYRILETSGAAIPQLNQYYEVPSVPCVRVTAGLTRNTHGQGTVIDELFPQDIWNRMVREAMVDLTRGEVNYHKLVGNFTQIVAGHSYNGVDAVVGSVPVEKIPVLIALSATSAATTLAKMRAGIRVGIDRELKARELRSGWTAKLSLRLFLESLRGVVTAPVKIVVALLEPLVKYSGEKLLTQLVKVEVVEQLRRIPVDIYAKVIVGQEVVPPDEFPMREHRLRRYDLDGFLTQMAHEYDDAKAPVIVSHTDEGQEVSKPIQGIAVPGSSASTVGGETLVEGERPDWMPLTHKTDKYRRSEIAHSAADRKASISEEIKINRQEVSNKEAWFAVRWSEIMASGKPDEKLVRKKRDEWKDLDVWFVNQGVFSYSVYNRDASTLRHSGAYCPTGLNVDGEVSFMRQIDEHMFTPSDGRQTVVHRVLGGDSYTGFVLVNEQTLVYNGPLIEKGLKRALGCNFDYEAGCYQGGPGCGKTHSIMERWNGVQQVTSPLVLSVLDVRKQMIKKRPSLTAAAVQKLARTVDSWLCLAGRGGNIPHCEEIFVDEVYNGRISRVYALAALMRARRIVCYGDPKQIPPVDESGASRIYKSIQAEHNVFQYIIYRFGPEILATINPHYNNELRSVHPVGYSQVRYVDDHTKLVAMSDEFIMMSMYQVQLVTAKKYFPAWKSSIMSTHQAQGKSVKEAMLCQLDTRLRPNGDPFNLFNDPNYLCVGLSRAKKFLWVCKLSSSSEKLTEWVDRAKDPRRVAACADVSTAGQSIEFL